MQQSGHVAKIRREWMHTAFRRVNLLENGHSGNKKGDGITLIFGIRRQVLRKGGGWNWHRIVSNGVTSLGVRSLTLSVLYTFWYYDTGSLFVSANVQQLKTLRMRESYGLLFFLGVNLRAVFRSALRDADLPELWTEWSGKPQAFIFCASLFLILKRLINVKNSHKGSSLYFQSLPLNTIVFSFRNLYSLLAADM